MSVQPKWQSSDGSLFDSEHEAENYEREQDERINSDKVAKFMETYEGRGLAKAYPDMEVEGIWEVLGEDSNCDFGGPHHMPKLFTAEGCLIDVVKRAVATPGFWTWGAGGKIRKVEVIKLDKL